jgi:sporulation protein YlmC with PRC-barrel domain
MAEQQTASLHKLSDAHLTVADPAEDIRGRQVVDRHGDEVGKVDDLMIDDRERKVRFMRVASGGFLGLGETTFMIPIDAITRITDDEVRIDQTREHVAGGPKYDPALANNDYWGSTYGYYGYTPYWGPGYMYPMYPYYRW